LLERSYALHAREGAVTSGADEEEAMEERVEEEGMEEEHVSDEGSSLDEIWSSLANELHPCLVKVHAQLRRWVSDLPLRSPADEASMLGAIKAVARARRALWSRSVRRSAAAAGGAEGEGADASVGRDLQAFLVGWRALHKLLARLTKPPTLLELPVTLVRACDRLTRAARFDAPRFRAVLWKHGGHPAAPRSAAQLGALRALRDLALPLALSARAAPNPAPPTEPASLLPAALLPGAPPPSTTAMLPTLLEAAATVCPPLLLLRTMACHECVSVAANASAL
jgi:hypothetical protein